MPVRKFRSVEEMDGPSWYEPGAPELFRALRRVWGLSHRLLQPRFPRGVHKHRSIQAMNELQQAWDDAIFLAHRERQERELAALSRSPTSR
jgi:hypothetical protein